MTGNKNESISPAKPVDFKMWLDGFDDDKKKEAELNLTGFAKVLLKMAMEKKYGTARI